MNNSNNGNDNDNFNNKNNNSNNNSNNNNSNRGRDIGSVTNLLGFMFFVVLAISARKKK